jgi:hypothetical protein
MMKRLVTAVLTLGLIFGLGLGPAFAGGDKNRGTKGKGATQTKRLQSGKTTPPKTQTKKQSRTSKK